MENAFPGDVGIVNMDGNARYHCNPGIPYEAWPKGDDPLCRVKAAPLLSSFSRVECAGVFDKSVTDNRLTGFEDRPEKPLNRCRQTDQFGGIESSSEGGPLAGFELVEKRSGS